MGIRLLIADDDSNFRKVLGAELREDGYEVSEANCGKRIAELFEKNDYDVVLLDLNFPDSNGIEVLKEISSAESGAEVIILTAYGSISTAVEAMKLGAYDYLTKPFKFEELTAVIEKANEKKEIRNENLILKTQIKSQAQGRRILTRSPLVLKVLDDAKNFALSEFPVAIFGESGAGKELMAEEIHKSSQRAKGPFIRINCGAIPENMIESELFGHEKGSFTGAHERKLGLIEIANHGTLLLDEVGELPFSLQRRLLRVIESGMFFRVGGTREVAVDVRFVSATNKDLHQEVEKGNFREDLFYRLTTLTVHIPPLRKRREDIPLLVDHIISSKPGFKNRRLSKDAVHILSEYSWPGNVRELQNVLYRTLLLSNHDIITPADLPKDLIEKKKIRVAGKRLKDVEREHILTVLEEANGKRGQAAEMLGVDPKTLYRKLSRFGIVD